MWVQGKYVDCLTALYDPSTQYKVLYCTSSWPEGRGRRSLSTWLSLSHHRRAYTRQIATLYLVHTVLFWHASLRTLLPIHPYLLCTCIPDLVCTVRKYVQTHTQSYLVPARLSTAPPRHHATPRPAPEDGAEPAERCGAVRCGRLPDSVPLCQEHLCMYVDTRSFSPSPSFFLSLSLSLIVFFPSCVGSGAVSAAAAVVVMVMMLLSLLLLPLLCRAVSSRLVSDRVLSCHAAPITCRPPSQRHSLPSRPASQARSAGTASPLRP